MPETALPERALPERARAVGPRAATDLREAQEAARTPAYAWLLIASLGLNIFSGFWDLLGVPLPLDRLVFLASVASYVWTTRRDRAVFRPTAVHALMLALSVLGVVSAVAVGALGDRESLFALLDRLVGPFLLFAYAPLALATPRTRWLLLQGLTLLGVYVGITTVISVTGPLALLVPRYLADPTVGTSFGRGRGPSADPVGTGLVLIACVAASLLVLGPSRGRWRLLAVVSSVACTLGIVLTLTRSIWLGALLALAAAFVSLPGLRRRLAVVVAGAAAVTVLGFALIPHLAATAMARLETSRSLDDRAYTNEAAVQMVLTRPLTGVGWGRFVDSSSSYVWQHDLGPITTVDIEVHNVFLARAAELGVPGLVLFLVVVLLGPVRAVLLGRRRTTGPPDAVALHLLTTSVVVSWLCAAMFTGLSYPLPNLLMWGLSGIACAHLATPPRPVRDRARARTRTVRA